MIKKESKNKFFKTQKNVVHCRICGNAFGGTICKASSTIRAGI